MDLQAAQDSIQPALDALTTAWNRGDGEAFAAACTADVDFVNLLGMHAQGRAAVAAMHDKIFKGPYLDSTLAFSVDKVRPISNDAVLAIVPGELQIPSGPVQGVVRTVATVLFVRDGSEWRVASFQNTRREATQQNHAAIMRDTLSS